jgi:hypothetical protein
MVVGSSSALFVRQYCAGPETCTSGSPLTWSNGVKVYVVPGAATPGTGAYLDLTNWTTGAGGTYEYWTVNNGAITLGQTVGTPVLCSPAGLSSQPLGGGLSLNLRSVPATETLQVDLYTPQPASGKLDLIDNQGKAIQTTPLVLNQELNQLNLPLTGLSPGIYVLRVRVGGEILSRRFLKL